MTSRKPLTLRERINIEKYYCDEGLSLGKIGEKLKRNKSSISREVQGKARSGRSRYRADTAHKRAEARIANRGNVRKLEKNMQLHDYMVEKLELGWSPEQISIRLPIEYPDDTSMRISYEAIYEYIYDQVYRKGYGYVKPHKEDLRSLLPRKRKTRMKKGARKTRKLAVAHKLPSIEVRPEVVDTRERIGDWEDDTMVSRQSKVRIKSITERKSGVVFFGKALDGTVHSCDEVVRNKLQLVPSEYLKTLTRDNGKENLGYDALQEDLGLSIFFAHPYCSQERGSNENDNGLLRRFYPKKTDFATVSDEDISRVEYLINTRPRKRHRGLTPAEVFYQETGVALFS